MLRKQTIIALLLSSFSFLLIHGTAQTIHANASSSIDNPGLVDFPYPDQNLNLSLLNNAKYGGTKSAASATRRLSASVRKKLTKNTYRADETIAVSFNNQGEDLLTMELLNAKKEIVTVAVEETTSQGITTLKIIPSNKIKPGKYTIVVYGIEGKMLEQDFTWGVLALNTNKSFYKPNETARIEIAVLNELGNMVCNANLTLEIKNDDLGINDVLTTRNGAIVTNPECFGHDYTLKPDYETSYKVGQPGRYALTLTAWTENGEYTITDAFEVRDSVPFDIERITATRIYPPYSYPVTFKITANQDFEGTIKETIPTNFTVSPLSTKSAEANTVLGENTVTLNTEVTQPSSESATADQAASESAPLNQSLPSTPYKMPLPEEALNPVLVPKLIDIPPSLSYPFAGNFLLTQGFGTQPDDVYLWTKYKAFGVTGHDGIDFALPVGTPVLATDGGVVIFAEDGDYGITVIIQHSWGRSYYGHLSEVKVTRGQEVGRHTEIGLSGNTGLSSGPHLHFGIRLNQYNFANGFFGKIDPSIYLTNADTTAVLGMVPTEDATNSITTTGVNEISIPLKMKAGENVTLEYKYIAPRVSPQRYLLGPLQFINNDKTIVFHESRQWAIAADAVWLDAGWNFRKAITIDAGEVSDTGSSNYTNFPVLISLSSDTELAANALDNGFDILFTSADGSTKIPAEIVSFNGSTGALTAWVNIPTLDYNDDTIIYMYYGNPSSCDQTSSSCTTVDGTKNKNTTWTLANYIGVWHLEQTPTTLQEDSTGNGWDLSYSGSMNSADSVAAKIGQGLDFDGSNDYIYHNYNSAFDPSSQITVSAWINFDVLPGTKGEDAYWASVFKTTSPFYSWRTYVGTDNRLAANWYNGSSSNFSNSSSTITAGSYRYVVYTNISGTSTEHYLNGSNVTSGSPSTSGSLSPANNQLRWGAGSGSSVRVDGKMDELRLASVGRSDGWVTTEYNNQNNPSNFITLGSQECMTPPSTDKQMRHGKYFDVCGRGAFTW